MVDYHVHPYYSLDGHGTIRDYCLKAKEIGIKGIGFTPHLELDPQRREIDDKVRLGDRIVSMRSDWIDVYLKDIEEARREFPELIIKAGLEVGYTEESEEEIARILSNYRLDYILGAIHCLDHISITSKNEYMDYFKNASVKRYCADYFYLLEKAIRSGLFEIIAHFDVYKKFGLSYYGKELLLTAEPYIKPILELMREKGIGLEINTAGLRREIRDIYPGEELLRKAKGIGVRVISIGSDAHEVEHLGVGIEKGLEIAERVGIEIEWKG